MGQASDRLILHSVSNPEQPNACGAHINAKVGEPPPTFPMQHRELQALLPLKMEVLRNHLGELSCVGSRATLKIHCRLPILLDLS